MKEVWLLEFRASSIMPLATILINGGRRWIYEPDEIKATVTLMLLGLPSWLDSHTRSRVIRRPIAGEAISTSE